MKIIAVGAALALTAVSWSAAAERQTPAHEQPSVEAQCKAMGEQHGMTGDKMDSWMKKCLEVSKQMHDGMDMDGKGDAGGAQDKGDLEDPQDGDRAMGGNTNK